MTAVPHPRQGEAIVWGVHVTSRGLDGDVITGPIESVWSEDSIARDVARERSLDEEVQAVAVTSYVVDVPGTRRRVVLYVNGVTQKRPYLVDNNHQWVRG